MLKIQFAIDVVNMECMNKESCPTLFIHNLIE